MSRGAGMLVALLVLVLQSRDGLAQETLDLQLASVDAQAITNGTLLTADLPPSRPLPPTSGWLFCSQLAPACVRSVTVTVSNATAGGVLIMNIIHKPVKNVTTTMLAWLYNNLDKEFSYVVSSKTYRHSLFLRMHPVDHWHHATNTSSKPTTMDWIETPLYGCRQAAKFNANQPYNCPIKRIGPTTSSNLTNFNLFHTKLTSSVLQLDTSMYSSYVSATEATYFPMLPGGGTMRNVSSLTHTWKDTKDGASITTKLMLGLMKAGNHTAFETPSGSGFVPAIVKGANDKISSTFADGAQWIDKNITTLAYAMAMHFVQETQFLAQWLPASHAANAN